MQCDFHLAELWQPLGRCTWEGWETWQGTAGLSRCQEVCEVEGQIHSVERLLAWDHYPVSVAFNGEEDNVEIWSGKTSWAG